ncbi:hypothetical protein BpHYR1_015323 [Brachionus plicatilis]|uniref:Uncharacterized protein n=1 Tax=Brachionus plicatilis TaxID=10195 RepID=A0A3M7RFP4_BRAPC|nr:hypothetical protein BpHYR1_015323 [Brachionus plicatilis]
MFGTICLNHAKNQCLDHFQSKIFVLNKQGGICSKANHPIENKTRIIFGSNPQKCIGKFQFVTTFTIERGSSIGICLITNESSIWLRLKINCER